MEDREDGVCHPGPPPSIHAVCYYSGSWLTGPFPNSTVVTYLLPLIYKIVRVRKPQVLGLSLLSLTLGKSCGDESVGFGFPASETKASAQIIITTTFVALNFPWPLRLIPARDGREKARASTRMFHLAPFTKAPVPAVFSQVHRE